MASTSPANDAVDTHKRRRGRPPLLAKSTPLPGSLDRFLKPGSSSVASTFTCSPSAMAGYELASSENQNPNVVPCHDPISANETCGSKFEESTIFDSEQVSRDKSRKVLSSENPSTVPVDVLPGHSSSPNPNSNSAPMHDTTDNLNPLPNNDLENVPAAAAVNQVPIKVGRGRPCKKETVNINSSSLQGTDLPLSSDVPVLTASKDAHKMSKKGVKRKRAIVTGPLDVESRSVLIKEFKSEVASLIRFYHEDGKIDLTTAGVQNYGRRGEIAFLLEESGLPFSSLIANLLLQLKPTDDSQGRSDLTPALLRSLVLSIGERISFGTPNPDADVLEDDSEACLWCWEVRDIKLVPETFRNIVTYRRRKRRKIAERIAALAGIITALSATFDQDQDKSVLEKAEDALLKTENEELIRAHVSLWQQKTTPKVAVKESLKEQQRLARETEKEQRRLDKEGEKEKKRLEKEEEKRKLQQEKEKERRDKEKERLEREASKQRSKEALRQEKESRRQQEEAEKEQKRKEKEEADLRRQTALKKQANLMGRFLQSKKDQAESAPCLVGQIGVVPEAQNVSPFHQKIIHDMDSEMLKGDEKLFHDLLSLHVMAWKKYSLLSNRNMKRWGQRRFPKMTPVNELRLQGQSDGSEEAVEVQSGLVVATAGGCKRSRAEFEDSELNSEKPGPEWDDSGLMDFSALLEQDPVAEPHKSFHFENKRRKLLQFNKSYRPAYYGSFSKKSDVVRPRNPLGMDSNLDYENDSDEEWEEEDPGESLSDCEKDEEDEKPDLDEDEEAGDGFLVPDGYLSESEGAHVEESESESDAEQLQKFSAEADVIDSRPEGNHRLFKFARQCKVLEQLTDHALRCNRPYIVCNFHQHKSSTVIQSTDRTCLEALRVFPLVNGIRIEVPEDPQLAKTVDEVKNKSKQRSKKSLPETSLQEMVEILRSSTTGLKRLVNLLSMKFPAVSRSLLKDKVKEIADFVDNRWQVKKEVLEQLGISLPCPQAASVSEPVSKSPLQLKPITKFFSKRCLPPETAGLDDSSPFKGKKSYCGKSNTVASGDVLQDEAKSMPVQNNSIQSV
ncbi:hypothetical protein GOP47_0000321 [Adiantum capillus-veneris]|uniref:Chromatin assembly factor 1 subunit A n=1 Tax=Adiantum capillus-veneris TaxID=13818 RepID=A0A9D4VDB8_ADICA|nr:hypothetical protein GOP47_0000321 [Adiantum capillus-veneris]